MLGGVVFVLIPVVLFGFVPPAPADPAGLVARFPDVRAAMAAGGLIAFAAYVLWVAMLLALYRALRRTSLAPALLGTALTLLGFAVIFAETATQVAFDPISKLYHAPGATAAEQETLSLVWQGTQGMFNQLDTSAALLVSVGIVFLGVAMLRAPAFGRGRGGVSVVLGAVAFAAIPLFGVTSLLTALIVLPIFVILPILWGRKLYNLSRAA